MKYASSMEFNEKQVKAVKTAPTTMDTAVGMLLKANFGPANEPIKISKESELLDAFGYPTEYNYKDWFNAAGYLKYASNLYAVRPLADDETNAFMIIGKNVEPTNEQTAGDLYNETIASNTLEGITPTLHTMNVYNKWVSNLNDVAVFVCNGETEYNESISKADIMDNTLAKKMVYDRSSLPTITDFKNKDKIVVREVTWSAIDYSITGVTYYIYYANFTTPTTGTWVRTADTIVDGDRIYITSENLVYTVAIADTYVDVVPDNVLYEDTFVSQVGIVPITGYEEGDRILRRINTAVTDLFRVEILTSGIWTPNGEYVADGDVILSESDNTSYDVALVSGGGNGQDSLTFTSSADNIIEANTFTNDTTITRADTFLIKKDANGIITNSVVRYLDLTLYDTDYNPLTFENILPKRPDFTQNEIGLVVLRKNKEKYFEVAETFVHSLTSTSVTSSGKSNFIDDNVNKYSKLIYVKTNGCHNYTTSTDYISNNGFSVLDNVITDGGGIDYSSIHDYTTLYNVANSVFGSNGYIQPEILMGYDCGDPQLSTGYLDAMAVIAKNTEMSLAVVGLSRSTVGQSESDTNDEVIDDMGNRRTNTSFGALTEFNSFTFAVGQMKKFYDKYNDKFRWVSVTGDIVGMMCRNDVLFGVQSPCAGYKRGKFSNYSKMLFDSTYNQDELSYNGINAIIKDKDDKEFYLFEYMTNTLLDEIVKEANVRRMVIRIKQLLKNELKNNFFEFNNREVRDLTIYKIKGIFEAFKKNGGLFDYKLICDETNNTAERINANEFVLDIRLQPNRVIKHIQINIVNFDMGLNIKEGL